MRKITDFIINKRHFILILFIILTIGCGILSKKVEIIYDIAEYLPSTSETRIGMDIMEEEFAGTETSTLNLMFQDLPDEEKQEIKSDLEIIDGIESVDYDDTENYNKDNYTLYVITVDDESDSKLAADVYNQVTEKYKNYTIYTSGDVTETNEDVLPIWIIILAIACALVILIIMCESYAEPFLFLTAILMAVVLNKGTNIIFGSVSNITNSIAAILQLALSMDYSIMLMNRYEQEKKVQNDKVTAMKNALYHAFQAISSSSITTIVGLLALVFMRFRIGKDLGFVLAKGVLFSLLCIFFVLPSLILMFDKLIRKTKKKSPNIKLDALGKFSHKIRYVAIPLFLAVFLTSFLLKGNLGIDYTASQLDDISKVFKENNQIAIIYKNDQEEKIQKYLEELENNELVDEVLAYGNTIGEKLTYDKLNNQLNNLGADVNIEDYLLKILYYNYYNPEITNKMTFNEFISFIENEAYNNETMSKEIDENTRKDITRLKNFVTQNSINQKRTSGEIASILDIDKQSTDDLLTYYLSKNGNIKISLNDFINFMNKEVLNNKKYSSKIDKNARDNLNTLSKFTNKQTIKKKMTSKQMADLFGIEESLINELYKYYISVNDIDLKLTISEFSNFVLSDVVTNSQYSSSFDEEALQNINQLATFSNLSLINKSSSSSELSKLFGIDENMVNQLLYLKYLNSEDATNPSAWAMSPYEFVNLILQNMDNEMIKNSIDDTTSNKLKLVSNIMTSSINKTNYSYKELSKFIGIDSSTLKNIYTLYVSKNSTTYLTPQEFVQFVLTHKNDAQLSNNIKASTISDLNKIQSVMKGVIDNKKYNSEELSNLLGINREDLKLIYGLYNFKYINTNPSLSLKDFVSFVLNDVITNKEYSKNFDDEKISKLNTVNGIMENSLKNTTYTSDEIFLVLSKLSNDVEKNTIEILYTYYGSNNNYDDTWQITVEEFVRYLNEDILQDERYTDFIEDDMRQDIIDAKQEIIDAKDLLIGDNYSRIVLNTKFEPETEETFNFVQKVKDILGRRCR